MRTHPTNCKVCKQKDLQLPKQSCGKLSHPKGIIFLITVYRHYEGHRLFRRRRDVRRRADGRRPKRRPSTDRHHRGRRFDRRQVHLQEADHRRVDETEKVRSGSPGHQLRSRKRGAEGSVR